VFVIFLHRQTASIDLGSLDNKSVISRDGATPFDSGGLWHDHVKTRPHLNELDKKHFFLRQSVQLTNWQREFVAYVDHNYSEVKEYIRGAIPRYGTPPIILSHPNETRAWAWEVRYPPSLARNHITLERIYMRRKQRDEYVKWLWRESALEDSEARSVHRWLVDNLVEVREQDSPFAIVEDHLLARVV